MSFAENTFEFPTPPPPPKAPADRDISAGFRRSLYFHLALATVILLKSLVFPGDPVRYIPTLRVDVVGLPDLLKKDLMDLPKAPPPPGQSAQETKKSEEAAKESKTVKTPPHKAEAAAKDEMVLHPKRASEQEKKKEKAREKQIERRNQNALARIKALARLGSADAPPAEKTHAKGQLVKGNAISKGTSLSGDAKEAAEASYFDLLRDRLQENWALPVWIARQNLSARVQIYIDSYGSLRSFRIVKSSGNPQFDDAVKNTLKESQPYPTPPAGIASSVLADGVLVGFPL